MNKLFLIFATLLSVYTNCQELFVISDRSISVQQFEEKYALNIESEGLEKALAQMVDAELWYQGAINGGMENRKGIQALLEKSKKRLLNEYVFNKPDIKEHLDEEYQRYLTDRKVDFLFFGVSDKVGFEERFSQAKKIRKQWSKKDFLLNKFLKNNTDSLIVGSENYYVRGMQEDPSFEQLTFDTPLNSISEPTAIASGVLLIKPKSEEKHNGDLRIRAISFDSDQNATAQKAYTELTNGMNFVKALSQYSNLPGEKTSGGYMPFRGNNIPSKIKEIVSKLEPKAYSKPQLINDRYYIFQLYSQEKCAEDDSICKEKFVKNYLNTSRYRTVDEKLYTSESKNMVPVHVDSLALKLFLKKAIQNKEPLGDPALATVGSKSIHAQEFWNRLKANIAVVTNRENYVRNELQRLLRQTVYDEYTDNLENYNADFAKKWELAKKEILISSWFASGFDVDPKKDSAKLRAFYNNNKTLFWDDKRMKGDFYVCYEAEAAQQVLKRIEKGETAENIVKAFKTQLTEKGNPLVSVFSGEYKIDSPQFSDLVDYKLGISTWDKDGKHYIFHSKKLIPYGPVDYENITSLVIKHYKDSLRDRKIEDLRVATPHGFKKYALRDLRAKYKK